MLKANIPPPFKLAALILIVVFALSIKLINDRDKYLKGGNIIYDAEQVLGAQAETAELTVDYSKKIANGHPEVFGGAHGPSLQHPDAWDMLSDIGVTSLKRDINLQYEPPLKSNLKEYLLNNYGKDNTSNFNWQRINETKKIFQNAKDRGMKTVAVTAYMPTWLSLNGKSSGIASDWLIYEDIIRKIYKIHRPNLDYFEISNEPDLRSFLDPAGSDLSPQKAYLELFLHTSRAVRQVDKEANDGKRTLIGGGITSEPNQPSYLEALLADDEARSYLSFTSYHTYGHPEPTSTRTKEILKKYNMESLPIHITEWNKSSITNKYNDFHTTDLAIAYTGSQLIEFLNNGYAGANYFTMSHNDVKRPNTVFSVYGIYQMVNNTIKAFPQTKTWTVLSKMSNLGKGSSTIYQTTYEQNVKIDVLAFKNVDGKYGLAISNPTNISYTLNVNLNNIMASNRTKLTAYEASKNWNAAEPKGTLTTDFSGEKKIQIFIAPMTVVSVVAE